MKTLLTLGILFSINLSFAQTDTLQKNQTASNTAGTKADTSKTLVVKKPSPNPDKEQTLTDIKARSEKVKRTTDKRYKGKKAAKTVNQTTK